MAYGTIISSGTITATGANLIVNLPTGVDWMQVINMNTAPIAASRNFKFIWQRGMAAGTGYCEGYTAGPAMQAGTIVGTGGLGFTLYDSSLQLTSAAVAVAAGTNVPSPVYTSALAPVEVGTIVRITQTAHSDINGLDFSVGAIGVGTFTMRAILQQAPGVVAGAAGFARIIAPNLASYKLFYPSNRVIANITNAVTPLVTTLVDHGYVPGMVVRFYVPPAEGMTELQLLTGTVLTTPAVNTFTVNIDTTTFTPFVYPLPAAVPFTPAQCVPVGEDTAFALAQVPQLNVLADAKRNQGVMGMALLTSPVAATALLSVGGTLNDVLYYIAGKSENL